MGFRFRKRIKLAPGFSLNLGLKSVSLSCGKRGASINFGSRGIFSNIGIPGTGLSHRMKLTSSIPSNTKTNREIRYVDFPIKLKITDDGAVQFLSSTGEQLPNNIVNNIKKHNAEIIEQALNEHIEDNNKDFDECMASHELTRSTPYATYDFPPPKKPRLERIGFFENLFGMAEEPKQRNLKRKLQYNESLREWYKRRDEWPSKLEKAKQGDVDSMSYILEEVLKFITWPKETNINFEFVKMDSLLLKLDVDLPEIEMMPKLSYSRASRGIKINVKCLPLNEIRQCYAKMIHNICFRILGECFAALPSLNQVILSGYTQRINELTGHENDVYIISTKCEREIWSTINLQNLKEINTIESLKLFDLRRELKRNHDMDPIVPFD